MTPPQQSDLRWMFESIQTPVRRRILINKVHRAATPRIQAMLVKRLQALIDGLRREGYHGAAIDDMQCRLDGVKN